MKGRTLVRFSFKTVAIVLIGVILAGLTWWFYARPAVSSLNTAKDDLASTQSVVDRLQQRLTRSNDPSAASVDALYAQVQQADALLPTFVDASTVVTEVPAATAQYGLTLNALDSKGGMKGPANGLMHQDFGVGVSGSCSGITSWLESVKTGSKLVSPAGVAVTETAGSCSASLTLQYWYSTTKPLQPGS